MARLLLAALEEHARSAEFTCLTATTCALNAPALRTFQRAGFTEVFRGRMDGKPEPEVSEGGRGQGGLGFGMSPSLRFALGATPDLSSSRSWKVHGSNLKFRPP